MQGYRRALTALAMFSAAVASPNVAMRAILSPLGVVDSGQAVVPRVAVLNSGDVSADSFWAHLTVDDEMDAVVYHDSVMLLGLQPGERDTAEFTPWVPVDRDSATTVAWTWWDEDSVPEDDTLAQRFFVRVRRIGITPIWPPPHDTIDPGVYYPQCEVWNHGNQNATLRLSFSIVGPSPYFDTIWVRNLLPGGSRTVTVVTPWQAFGPGMHIYTLSCSLVGAMRPDSIVFVCTLWVRGIIDKDVACEQILVPSGVIDTLPFAPQVRYANYGMSDVTCTTYCWIEDTTDSILYSDDSPVILMAGGSTTVAYRPCTLKVEGPYVVSCSIHLPADQNWLNNALHRPFRVGTASGHDVGIEDILIPAIVDSGTVVAPMVVVGNYGQWPETFPVYFLLPGGYLDRVDIIELAIGMYDTVPFRNWEAAFPPGCTVVMAWTLLEGDENPSNDTMIKPFTIQVRDIGVEDILIRVDTMPNDSFLVYLRCAVRNNGNTVETFEVLTGGPDRETIFGLPGQTSDTATFDPILLPSGVYLLWAKVVPNPWPDMNTSNDIMYDTLWLPGRIRHDVGVVEITSPVGVHDTIGMLDVSATVRNYGENTEAFWTYFSIFDESSTRVYCDSIQTESLVPGRSAELTFRQADINVLGWYTARCSTYLADDQNWTNNLVTGMFRIETAGGVQESQSLPPVFGLDAIRPNPFRAKAATRFTLPGPSRVDLAVFSSDGRRVRTLACGRLDAGRYEVVWDGNGEAGRPVARSVYYLRFVAGDCVLQKKLVKTE